MGKITSKANEGKIWDGAGILLFWVVVVSFYLATAAWLGIKMVALQAGPLGGLSYTPVTLDQSDYNSDAGKRIPL